MTRSSRINPGGYAFRIRLCANPPNPAKNEPRKNIESSERGASTLSGIALETANHMAATADLNIGEAAWIHEYIPTAVSKS